MDSLKIFSIKGKKGDEKIMFGFMVFVWFLVGLGVMLGIYFVYGEESDIKEFQAEILSDRIAGCLVRDSKLAPELYKENNEFDLYKLCNFNKDTLSGNKFYVSINFNYIDGDKVGEKFREQVVTGNPDAITQCALREKNIRAERYFRCVGKKYYALTSENKVVLVDIFTGSNNEGGRF
ncbi:MAG: hypothetical protein QXI33_00600 [Candidatus Pacearchaeota archaeon]